MDANAKITVGRRGRTIVGEGRYDLLRLIEETGSLSGAASAMSMSYRYAWGVIKHLEEEMGGPLVKSHRGGERGGWTELTDLARELISEFEIARDLVSEALDGSLVSVELVLVVRRGGDVLSLDGRLPRGAIKKKLSIADSFRRIARDMGVEVKGMADPRPIWDRGSGKLSLVWVGATSGPSASEWSEISMLDDVDRAILTAL